MDEGEDGQVLLVAFVEVEFIADVEKELREFALALLQRLIAQFPLAVFHNIRLDQVCNFNQLCHLPVPLPLWTGGEIDDEVIDQDLQFEALSL